MSYAWASPRSRQTTFDRSALSLLAVELILQWAYPLTPDILDDEMHVKKEREHLDAVISVRLTAEEKVKLKEDADLAGLSVSELVRRRAFGRPVIAHTDELMIKELRRLGGLLKHIYAESKGMYSKDTAAALAAVKNYIERLSRDREKGG